VPLLDYLATLAKEYVVSSGSSLHSEQQGQQSQSVTCLVNNRMLWRPDPLDSSWPLSGVLRA
jgi:hypothetical protein